MWYAEQRSAFYFFSLRTGIWIIIGWDVFIGEAFWFLIAATLGFLGLRSNQSKFIFCMWIFDILGMICTAIIWPYFILYEGYPAFYWAIVGINTPTWLYFGCIEYSYYKVLLRKEQDAIATNAAQYFVTDPNSEQTDEQQVEGQQVQEPLVILKQMVQDPQLQGQQLQGQQLQWETVQEQPLQWETVQEQPLQWETVQEQPLQWETVQEQPLQWETVQEQPLQEQQSQGQPELV